MFDVMAVCVWIACLDSFYESFLFEQRRASEAAA